MAGYEAPERADHTTRNCTLAILAAVVAGGLFPYFGAGVAVVLAYIMRNHKRTMVALIVIAILWLISGTFFTAVGGNGVTTGG